MVVRAPAILMFYFGCVFLASALRTGSFKGSNIHVINLAIYLRHLFTLRSRVSKICHCVAKHRIEHCCFVDNSQAFNQLIKIIEAKYPYYILNTPYHIFQ